MTAQARRARLPLKIRRKIQTAVRYFVFISLSYVVLSEGYRNMNLFLQHRDVMKAYGFWEQGTIEHWNGKKITVQSTTTKQNKQFYFHS